MTDAIAPVVYRINRKMADKLVPRLNKSDIYVESIDYYLDKDILKQVAGVPNAKGISSVYVNESRVGKVAHRTLRYNNTYCGGDQPIYGNIVIVLGPKAYDALPAELKTTDVNSIVL